MRIATTADNPTDPAPKTGTILRGIRFPTVARTAKLASGSAGINHNRWSTLSFHLTHSISIQRFKPVVAPEDQGKSHRHFSGRHGQNKHEHNLPQVKIAG